MSGGNYYIGQGQTYPNYPTLTMAVEELKLRLMGGPINFYLTNNSETPYSESNGEIFPDFF